MDSKKINLQNKFPLLCKGYFVAHPLTKEVTFENLNGFSNKHILLVDYFYYLFSIEDTIMFSYQLFEKIILYKICENINISNKTEFLNYFADIAFDIFQNKTIEINNLKYNPAIDVVLDNESIGNLKFKNAEFYDFFLAYRFANDVQSYFLHKNLLKTDGLFKDFLCELLFEKYTLPFLSINHFDASVLCTSVAVSIYKLPLWELPKQTMLIINEIDNINIMFGFIFLEYLEIKIKNDEDLSLLSKLTNILTLEIETENDCNLNLLNELLNLFSLSITFKKTQALNQFYFGFKELNYLCLDNCIVDDCTNLDCLNIKELSFRNSGLFSSNFLLKLNKLQSIVVSNTSIKINDFFLQSDSIKKVSFYNYDEIDISIYSKLKYLNEIEVANCKVLNIEKLKDNNQLNCIQFSACNIIDYESIGKLKQLTELKFRNCNMVDIWFLFSLNNLQYAVFEDYILDYLPLLLNKNKIYARLGLPTKYLTKYDNINWANEEKLRKIIIEIEYFKTIYEFNFEGLKTLDLLYELRHMHFLRLKSPDITIVENLKILENIESIDIQSDFAIELSRISVPKSLIHFSIENFSIDQNFDNFQLDNIEYLNFDNGKLDSTIDLAKLKVCSLRNIQLRYDLRFNSIEYLVLENIKIIDESITFEMPKLLTLVLDNTSISYNLISKLPKLKNIYLVNSKIDNIISDCKIRIKYFDLEK